MTLFNLYTIILSAAEEVAETAGTDMGMVALGAGLAMVGLLGAGIGMGLAISKALESAARQPEMISKLQMLMIVGLAFIETVIIFGFVGAILILILGGGA